MTPLLENRQADSERDSSRTTSRLRKILCAGKKEEQVELLELGQSGIHVAEYLTVLPPRELLRQKLHAAIQTSRARLAR